uniref:Uncharacterized protein n=1 Tax=Oryza barthii TaxID=65489 RepID=A0A0D3FWV6_9ORYZ
MAKQEKRKTDWDLGENGFRSPEQAGKWEWVAHLSLSKASPSAAAVAPPPPTVLPDSVLAAMSHHEGGSTELVFAGGDKGMSQMKFRIKTGC